MRKRPATALSALTAHASDSLRFQSSFPPARVEALGLGVRAAAYWARSLHGVQAERAGRVSAPAP